MPYFSSKNKRFRTKEQMIDDIIFGLKSFHNKQLSYEGAYNIVHEVMWQWTEYNGKYKGNLYWSEKAIDLFFENPASQNPKTMGKFFRADHIVPKKIIVEYLFELNELNKEVIFDYFNKNLISCIVTIEEDKLLGSDLREKMPENYSNEVEYEWFRYYTKKIIPRKVVWVKEGKELILENHMPIF